MIGTRRTARRLLLLGFVLAALLAPGAPPARAVLAPSMFALTNGNVLLKIKAASPATIEKTILISGLLANEDIVAIDFRPATGQLYGLGVINVVGPESGRLYTINTDSGAATPVGSGPFSTALADDANYGFDFNPIADRIRLVNSADQNMRLNPVTGALSGLDQPLDNAATGEEVFSAAYDRNVSGANLTTLYVIDLFGDQLMRQGGADGNPSPNGGALTPIGPLGILLGSRLGGFDIGADGSAYASIQPLGGLFQLYRINLASGAATLVGTIGNGSVPIAGLAVVLPRYAYIPLISK
ncbi:MAG TPA: DUF4394 domain-containing protein [Herpetosiphonaceae bacterium]|nr:DUF4394 domain-containing protein [Herpetosiphonaceae bacterium]